MEKKVRVLIVDPIHADGVKMLTQYGLEVDLKFNLTKDQLLEAIPSYEVLIVRSRTKVTREVLEAAKDLKIIGRAGYGLDNIDVKEAKRRGILVLSTPDAPSTSVAELTMGLIVSLMRRIVAADVSMKKGLWLKRDFMGLELKGKTIGIVGFGRIGRRVAHISGTMGMRVLITDPYKNPVIRGRLRAKKVPLDMLLRESDIVTLHVPLNSHTLRMIGEREFQMMKPGAYLINTSRGAVIDEKALLRALEGGKLAGAALDVYEHEPPTNMNLIRRDDVVCTPHIGAQTEEAQMAAAKIIARKIIKSIERGVGRIRKVYQ